MRRVLLDLYTKSGKSSVLYSSAYSDKEKNTKTLLAPALTIYGESTPDSFYAGLSEQHIADGLIPRFLIIEYKGGRPKRNRNAFAPPSDYLVDRLSDLIGTALRMQANNSFQTVELDATAAELMKQFDKECDQHINRGQDEATRQLWNRAHLKSLRMAAVLAAAENMHTPLVTEEMASWAIDTVHRDIEALDKKFAKGDIGQGYTKQLADLRRVVVEYIEKDFEDLEKYGVTEKLWNKRVMPYTYVQRRVANLAAFKKDRRGTKYAIRGAIEELESTGVVEKVPRQQLKNDFSYGGDAWFIRDITSLLED